MAISALSPVKRLAAFRPEGKAGTALLAGAAVLAASALWNSSRARRAERDHPPRGQFLEVDGTRLHYLERGSGPAVVLLHGNVVTAEDYVWSGVFDRLVERGHRVVAIDRPGFGHSERPQGKLWTPAAQARLLRQAFASWALSDLVVVGHSWGTLVALAMALDAPDAVGGLVLLSGYYKPTARLDVLLAAPPLSRCSATCCATRSRHCSGARCCRSTSRPCSLRSRYPTTFAMTSPTVFLSRPWQIRAEAQDAASMVPAVAALRARYSDLQAAGDDHGRH